MFLPRLAWTNTKRNWIRSLLVIAGMAAAAFIMTASQSLTEGHMSWAFGMYRAFMGGDLVIYPLEMVVDRPVEESPEATWVWESWDRPWVNSLASFHPSIAREGFIRPAGSPVSHFELDDLPQVLRDHPEVAEVEPYLVQPALLTDGAGHSHWAPLRGLRVDSGRARGWEDLITLGRFFSEEEEAESRMVALVNAARPAYHPTELERSYAVPPLFEFIEVEVPRLVGWQDGFPVHDFGDTQTFRLRVVGYFALETHQDSILDGDGTPVRGAVDQVVYFPHFWNTPEIVIPEQAWHQIFEETSSGQSPRTYQIGVTVEDTLRARVVAEEIARELPGTTVTTVGDQAQGGDLRTRRVSSAVPQEQAERLMARAESALQPVASPDVSSLMAGLSFLLAGCLVVANAHILVMNRRKELGILRAVGMSGGEVLILILMELGALSLIGALLGFSMVSLLVGIGLLASGAGFTYTLMTSAALGARVVGSALLVSIVFGLWPALRAVRSTTMEVLAGE